MKNYFILAVILLISSSLVLGTVSSTSIKTPELDCDGSDTTFTFTFPYTATSEIKVDLINETTGAITRETETTHYSVSPSSSTSGGTVTFVTAPADGYVCVISRTTSNTQQSDVDSQLYWTYARTSIENALDKNTRIDQEQADEISRSIRFPVGDVGFSGTLPSATARAGTFPYFGDDGTLTVSSSGITDATTVSSYMTTVVDDANALLAMNTLSGIYVYNVKTYGATGDGATDDSTAIQAAIDAASAAGGGTVYFPAGTYRMEVTDSSTDSKVSYKGSGYGTVLKANTDGNYVLTITGGGNWKKRLISGFKFDGNIAAARQGNGIYLNYDETSCEISYCWFSECDYAIKAVWGMGNYVHDNDFYHNNYGWHATSGGTDGHIGDEIFRFNYWTGNRYAAVYMDGDGGATNNGYETRFEYDIFEQNTFAIYVTNYGYTINNSPLTIDSIHLETNGKTTPEDYNNPINGITPISTYFKDVQNLVINNTSLETYTFDTCRVNTFNCNLNQASWVQQEINSNVTHHSSISSGLSGNHFNNRLINPNVFNTSNYGVSYLTPERTNLTSAYTNLVSTGASCTNTFSPASSPDSNETYGVADGQLGKCIEVVFDTGQVYAYSLQIWPFAVTSGKWYVWSMNIKGNGADANMTVMLTGDDTLHSTHGNKIAVKNGIWQTVSGITLANASGNDSFYIYHEQAAYPHIRFSAVQVVEFTNKNDALLYLESSNYAIPTEIANMAFKVSNETLLAVAGVNLASATAQTLYTVPTGKRCVLTKAVLVAGGDASTSSLTIGKSTALTDFLGTQTLSNINAQYDVAILQPVPNATPVLTKSYAAGAIIQTNVTSAVGNASNALYLYGLLY